MQPEYNFGGSTSGSSTRKLAGLLIVISILVVSAFVVGRRFFYLKTVVLKPTSGTRITLKSSFDDYVGEIETLASASSETSIKVKPGSYTVVYSGDGYNEKTDLVEVKKPTVITTPLLSLTEKKLAEIYARDKAAIESVATSVIPSGYRMVDEKLYLGGDWFAAKLQPGDPDVDDEKRLVLQRKGAMWEVVAGPAIVFFLDDFPSIPQEVIRNINNR